MGRIIINYDDDIPTLNTIRYVNAVISMGRISGLNKESYCYCTTMKDDTVVFADINKNRTDVFNIYIKDKVKYNKEVK